VLPLAGTLTGCAGDTSSQTFAPLDYSYLGQLHLNVGRVDVVDQAPSGSTPGDISAQAPTPPDQALQTMAHERVVASGSSGSATFTITHAIITRAPDNTLQGDLAVHIDILTSTGQHAGYAEAQVSRTLNAGEDDSTLRNALYALTSQMMQDMNVELEFQVRRSLKDWLVDAGGNPISGAIQQESLSVPGATPAPVTDSAAPAAATEAASPAAVAPATAAAPAAAAPQAPDAIFPTGGDTQSAPAVTQHSPQPGYLHLPGTSPGTTDETAAPQ